MFIRYKNCCHIKASMYQMNDSRFNLIFFYLSRSLNLKFNGLCANKACFEEELHIFDVLLRFLHWTGMVYRRDVVYLLCWPWRAARCRWHRPWETWRGGHRRCSPRPSTCSRPSAGPGIRCDTRLQRHTTL